MTNKEIEKGFQEIWKLFKETGKEIKETSKEVKETSRAVRDLTGKWGNFVEGLIVPAVERLFNEWGIEVDKVYQRARSRLNGSEMEIDILAVNGDYAILIEANSTLKIEDVNNHIKRLENFKSFFPEYKDRKIMGAVGGISIEEESDKYAYRQGMFVITESGETVKILNDKKFKPKEW